MSESQPSVFSDVKLRPAVIKTVLGSKEANKLHAHSRDQNVTLSDLKENALPEAVQRIILGSQLSMLAEDDDKLAESILEILPDAKTLRDVAMNLSLQDLDKLHTSQDHDVTAARKSPHLQKKPKEAPAPGTTFGAGDSGKIVNMENTRQAANFRRKLFNVESTGTLHRMVQDNEIPIGDDETRDGILTFLSNQPPSFQIRSSSVLPSMKEPEAFKGIPVEKHPDVISTVKQLATVQALAPTPEAISPLMKVGLTSAFEVSSVSEHDFVSKLTGTMDSDTARSVHQHAVTSRARNDHALLNMLQTVRGSGIAVIDGAETMESRKALLSRKLNDSISGQASDEAAPVIDLESLFGSLDYCECDDCNSILSPAAYFVEILQFLRNNNLSPDTANFPQSGKPGISGTVLERLFARRPDLGCLELTCENTNTVLPYIDLANEVMESFVVHRIAYQSDTHDPKRVKIDVHNIADEESSELLSEPQHTNYQAYCVLKDAVFPIVNAPYHQAIDEARILLNYLSTSRYELLTTFRHPYQHNSKFSASVNADLQKEHEMTTTRSAVAEFWGMTPIDYIAITKESYWSVKFWQIVKRTPEISEADYHTHIGRQPPWKYWGYSSEGTMRDTDQVAKSGLMFVKKQLLPRSGLVYADLVELVKTRYINPNFPQGRDLVIFESIRFNYLFLKNGLDNLPGQDMMKKFGKLVKFLQHWRPWAKRLGVKSKDMPPRFKIEDDELFCWLKNWFQPLGSLIVLESQAVPLLPISGYLLSALPPEEVRPARLVPSAVTTAESPSPPTFTDAQGTKYSKLGVLRANGTIMDGQTVIGSVSPDSTVLDKDLQPIRASHPEGRRMLIADRSIDNAQNKNSLDTTQMLATVTMESHLAWYSANPEDERLVEYLPVIETCNIDDVVLHYLDGTPLNVCDWDRMQAFIRLYRKLGWSIDETDQALVGLSQPKPSLTPPGSDDESEPITDYGQVIDRSCTTCGRSFDHCGCGRETPPCEIICASEGPAEPLEISPEFLEQLIDIKTLLDMSNLTLVQLLTIWSDIPTSGSPSLYSKLFLVHNIYAIDSIFKADSNGNYLTEPHQPIADHLPVILAAFRLTPEGLGAILSKAVLSPPGVITTQNISLIYRYVLLSNILSVKVTQLPGLIDLLGDLLGDPFVDAKTTLAFVRLWKKIQAKGFSFPQMNYLILDKNDPLRPIGPSVTSVLKTTKTIHDGLHQIVTTYPDYTDADKSKVTPELVSTLAALCFDPQTVAQIIGLVQGTTVYTTSAPTGLSITFPEILKSKITYSDDKVSVPPKGVLNVTGLLTDSEKAAAKKLADVDEWSKAIDRIGKQAGHFFDNYLFGVFPNDADAKAILLAGDILPPASSPPAPSTPSTTSPPAPTVDNSTSAGKRIRFLEGFMPFLRKILTERLVLDSISGPASISSPEIARILLSQVIKVSEPPVPAMEALTILPSDATVTSFSGYLVPTETDSFVFSTKGGFITKPPDLVLDGNSIPFTRQQDDPNDVWFTSSESPVALISGRLYKFVVSGQAVSNLQWKSSRSPISDIPSSVLLPDYTSSTTYEVFKAAFKVNMAISSFNLTADELLFFLTNSSDFDGLDLNKLTMKTWQRLADYTTLRDSLPSLPKSLLDLFKASKAPIGDLSTVLNSVTNWSSTDITKLLASDKSLSDPKLYSNEVQLLSMQRVLAVKDKIGLEIDVLYSWSDVRSFFWDKALVIAQDIRKQIRSRYDVATWEQVSQPLFNILREHQRDALIAFLLVQQPLRDWGVVDADSLFEFFLIDVQMGSCLQTSRIKQAISTVQLYVQRCLLNLEGGADKIYIDQKRWKSYMHGYRLWEADRKVFLWPELWLDPNLRDDKSALFKALEAKLMQKDINPTVVQDELKNYLFGLDQVANLEVIGLLRGKTNTDTVMLHIFAKTKATPYVFFYRRYDLENKLWSSWETMGVDIMTYEQQTSDGQLKRSGSYILPVIWNNRLLVFTPQFTKKQLPLKTGRTVIQLGDKTATNSTVIQYWEIKMGWTEYRNGSWTQKQISNDAVANIPVAPQDPPAAGHTEDKPPGLPDIENYQFVPKFAGTQPDTSVQIAVLNGVTTPIGVFGFNGGQVYVEASPAAFAISTALSTSFMYIGTAIHSYEDVPGSSSPLPIVTRSPWVDYATSQKPKISAGDAFQEVAFYDALSHQLLSRATTAPSVDGVYDFFNDFFTSASNDDKANAFGNDEAKPGPMSDYNELKTPYALGNWEIGCHAPMLLMKKLFATQQFEAALDVAHYVFDPFAKRSSPPLPGDVWRWPPFKNVVAQNSLDILFSKLKPNTRNDRGNEIELWRDNPFQPFVVARSRRQAMMKWFALQYIQILIGWGDYYFMQNTLESIPLAIQLYVRASHIYGPAAQQIPRRGKKAVQSYNSLLDKWDSFSNAVVQMELAFPFSNQSEKPFGLLNGDKLLPNLFGFATSRYFCIPNNPQMKAIRALIDDRLYKIRHCQDINGVVQHLPLFEPPIDPGLLVQAAAAGVSLSSVVNDLDAPMPNYRFYLLLQKALELCSELKNLGAQFLAVKEKIDAESLATLRANHETRINNLVMEVKKQALDEAYMTLEAHQQSRKAPMYRMKHFLTLIGEDLAKIPDDAHDFSPAMEIPNAMEAPSTTNNPLKLISLETNEMSTASRANEASADIAHLEALAGSLRK